MSSAPHSSKYIVGKTEDVSAKYDMGKVLGSGQYGRASIATSKKTGQRVAIKTIDKSRFRSDIAYQFEAMANEIDIMRKLDHPNIIKLVDVLESENELNIVMELCEGGELFDRIKEKRQYSEKEAQEVLRQICLGLDTLHSRRIAHCDLKPDNFLFVDKKSDKIKIIDFGMSKELRRRQYLRHVRGTPYYIAPEVLDGQYSEHCDMWSFGVIAFVMLFGFPPFHGDTDPVIFNKIRIGFDPSVRSGWGAWFPSATPVSSAARDLISRLLTKDPAIRLTSKETLEHPWMQGKDVPLAPLPSMVLTKINALVKKTKFSNAMLTHLTQKSMSEEEYLSLAKTFRFIDKNNDGVLTIDEFKQALKETDNKSVDEASIKAIIQQADMDGDGTISWKELLLATTARHLAAKEERLWRSFKSLDLNGDGKLSVDELRGALEKDTEEIKALIAEVDKDQNGMVDYDEFLSMFEAYDDSLQNSLLETMEGKAPVKATAGAAAAAAAASSSSSSGAAR